MLRKTMPSPSFPARRGSALIITLALLVLVTVLVLGFLTRAQLDVVSSRSHLSGVEAQLYAQAGVDMATSQLRTVIGDTNRFWVSQPGRLTTSPPGTNQPVGTVVELSSGTAATNAAADVAVNLNVGSFESPANGVIAVTNTPMVARWIYVRKDGNFDTAVPSSLNPDNPVIGRFAYWVDDESVKVNLNTAWTKDAANTNALAHVSRVSLDALVDQTEANAVQAWRTNASNPANHFFNSLPEAGAVSAAMEDLLKQQGFSLTVHNATPERNMFNEERIMLTTQQRHAAEGGSTNFLDILGTDNADPGKLSSLDATKLNDVVQKLVKVFSRTDYPMVSGQSFQAKYGGGNMATFFALNIIDYVRSAESSEAFIEPLRGTPVAGGGFTLAAAPAYAGSMMSHSGRRVYLSEMGMWVGAPAAGNLPVQTWCAVYVPGVLPGGNNADIAINLTAMGIYETVTNQISPITAAMVQNVGPGSSAAPVVRGGQYATMVHDYTRPIAVGAPRPSHFLNPVFGSGTTSFKPAIKLANSITIALSTDTYPGFDPVTPSGPPAHSYQVDDPVVNNRSQDWGYTASIAVPARASTFTAPWTHATTLGGTPSTAAPQQDTDSAGAVANGMYVPAPRGSGSNPDGVVHSVGELGFISTGANYTTASAAGVPWRTMRLQPQKSATDLPDWALLDMFSVPLAVAAADAPYVRPDPASVGGRINVNSRVFPFADDSGNPLLTRLLPLQALFYQATANLNAAQTALVADNIEARALAASGREYGTNRVFFAPGQIAEITGVADAGESSEGTIRSVVDLATTRSTVFSVYAIGQSLKQDKAGKIRQTGERRQLTILEKNNSSNTLRPVFSRSLSP